MSARGFTMIEVAMAVAVFATGILGIGSMLSTTHEVAASVERGHSGVRA